MKVYRVNEINYFKDKLKALEFLIDYFVEIKGKYFIQEKVIDCIDSKLISFKLKINDSVMVCCFEEIEVQE